VSPYHAWPFLSDPNHPFLSAVWAVLIHGTLAVVSVAPILWRSRHRLIYTALAFIGGFVLDIDHFIAAGSLNLHTIETLGGRPDTHSIIFIAGLAAVTLALTRSWLATWAVFAINLVHLLFDGAGGNEHVLYPFTSVDGIPWLLCPLGTLACLGVSAWLVRTPARRPGGPGDGGERFEQRQRDTVTVG
jgi:hypothetical protein